VIKYIGVMLVIFLEVLLILGIIKKTFIMNLINC